MAKFFKHILALLLGSFTLAQAELPLTRITSVFPPGGQAGTSVEVTIAGEGLEEVEKVWVSHPQITSETLGGNRFKISIGAQVPPQFHEIRTVGRYGASNSRLFLVGNHVEKVEVPAHAEREQAMELTVPGVVHARSEANAFDWYRFSLKKGQRVLVEVMAEELNSKMRPALILMRSDGRELQREMRGDVLDFTAPEEGTWFLKVYDFVYQGGPDYLYRLSVTADPRIDFVLPTTVIAGQKNQLTLYGRNLPGGQRQAGLKLGAFELESLIVEVDAPADSSLLQIARPLKPSAVALDGFEYQLRRENLISNPYFIGLSTNAPVVEANLNDLPSQAQKVTVPFEISGQFFPKNDQDWFSFEAKKGQILYVEVFSHRLGLAADPFLILQKVSKNEKGEESMSDVSELFDMEGNLASEFKTLTYDVARRWEVPEDATYRIMVRDTHNRSRADPRFVYRLCVRPERPDFRLVAFSPMPPPLNKESKEVKVWSSVLRPGGIIPIKVMAIRTSFGGEIKLSVEGLPPGVTAHPSTILNSTNGAFLLLTAREDAAPWTGPIQIMGRAKIADTDVTRLARAGTQIWSVGDTNTEPVQSRLFGQLIMSVSPEKYPLSVEAAVPQVEGRSGSKVEIPLKIVRRGEFQGPFKLKFAGHPALGIAKEIDVPEKVTEVKGELDLNAVKIPAGTYTVHLEGQVPGKYRNNAEASESAEKEALAAEKEFMDATTAAKTAEEAAKSASTETKANLDQASVAAAQKVKELEAKKTAARTKAQELAKKSAPKDVTITTYSVPFELKVLVPEKK